MASFASESGFNTLSGDGCLRSIVDAKSAHNCLITALPPTQNIEKRNQRMKFIAIKAPEAAARLSSFAARKIKCNFNKKPMLMDIAWQISHFGRSMKLNPRKNE